MFMSQILNITFHSHQLNIKREFLEGDTNRQLRTGKCNRIKLPIYNYTSTSIIKWITRRKIYLQLTNFIFYKLNL